jgi:hypothetical protein
VGFESIAIFTCFRRYGLYFWIRLILFFCHPLRDLLSLSSPMSHSPILYSHLDLNGRFCLKDEAPSRYYHIDFLKPDFSAGIRLGLSTYRLGLLTFRLSFPILLLSALPALAVSILFVIIHAQLHVLIAVPISPFIVSRLFTPRACSLFICLVYRL